MASKGSSGDFVPVPLALGGSSRDRETGTERGRRCVLPWIMDFAYSNSASRYANSSWPLLTVPYLPETLIWLQASAVAVKACQEAILWTNCAQAYNKLDNSFPCHLPWPLTEVIFIAHLFKIKHHSSAHSFVCPSTSAGCSLSLCSLANSSQCPI